MTKRPERGRGTTRKRGGPKESDLRAASSPSPPRRARRCGAPWPAPGTRPRLQQLFLEAGKAGKGEGGGEPVRGSSSPAASLATEGREGRLTSSSSTLIRTRTPIPALAHPLLLCFIRGSRARASAPGGTTLTTKETEKTLLATTARPPPTPPLPLLPLPRPELFLATSRAPAFATPPWPWTFSRSVPWPRRPW